MPSIPILTLGTEPGEERGATRQILWANIIIGGNGGSQGSSLERREKKFQAEVFLGY